jgi:hypothetical protein
MKKLVLTVAVLALVITIVGALVLSYLDELHAVKHETDRWVVIEDVNGDHIAVEPASNMVWEQLVQLCQNKTKRLIGGIVEEYGNKWGFRFKPGNVTVAEFTAEGLQATIIYISENIDYWLNGWAYVSAEVTEIHSSA